MRLFSLSIFFLLTSSFRAQATNNPDTVLTILKEKYSLQYPKSWTLDTSKMFGVDILLRSPKTDSLDDFNENMNLFVQDLHGQNYDLTRMGKQSETQIKNMVTDVQIIESRLDSTSSPQYYVLKYKGRQGKFILTIIQRYYLNDDIGYALTMTIKEGNEQDYITIADKIFNSFNFQ